MLRMNVIGVTVIFDLSEAQWLKLDSVEMCILSQSDAFMQKFKQTTGPNSISHARAWRDLLQSPLFPCAFASMKREIKQ